MCSKLTEEERSEKRYEYYETGRYSPGLLASVPAAVQVLDAKSVCNFENIVSLVPAFYTSYFVAN